MSTKGTSFQSRSESHLLDSVVFDDVDFPLIRNLLSDIHRLILRYRWLLKPSPPPLNLSRDILDTKASAYKNGYRTL